MSLGAHAEQVAVIPDATFPLPEGLSYEEGAAPPLNYLTALTALERRGQIRAGESVLVHGAAGGVGTAAVQVAKALGAKVVAAVSTHAKAEIARPVGADEVVIGEDFRARLDEPVDLIVDPVGGQERFTESLRALAPEGRIVVGFTFGEIPEVKVNRLLLRNVDVRGRSFGILAADPTESPMPCGGWRSWFARVRFTPGRIGPCARGRTDGAAGARRAPGHRQGRPDRVRPRGRIRRSRAGSRVGPLPIRDQPANRPSPSRGSHALRLNPERRPAGTAAASSHTQG
jgi:Zinc-binding dehydrogenase